MEDRARLIATFLTLVSAAPSPLAAAPRYAYFTNQNAVQRVLLEEAAIETLVPGQVISLETSVSTSLPSRLARRIRGADASVQ